MKYLLWVSLFLPTLPSFAQDCHDYSSTPSWLSCEYLGGGDGDCYGLSINGSGQTLVAARMASFTLVDVSDPRAPSSGATVNVPDYGPLEQVIEGDLLFYLTDHPNGDRLRIYDISGYPAQLSLTDCLGPASAMDLSGNTLFIAGGASLRSWDISSPSSPQHLSTASLPFYNAKCIIALEDLVLVLGSQALAFFDTSDPLAPALLSVLALPGTLSDMAVSGNSALVVDYETGLQVVDFSDSSLPLIVSSLDLEMGFASRIFVQEDRAWCYVPPYFRVLDIADPASPNLLFDFPVHNGCNGLCTDGEYLFLASSSSAGAVDVVAMGEGNSAAEAANIPLSGTPGREVLVDADENLGWMISADFLQIQRYDLADPLGPVLLNSEVSSGVQSMVLLESDYLLAANSYGNSFLVYDRSSLQLLASVDTGLPVRGLCLEGNLLCIAADVYGIQLYDLSDPLNPVFLGNSGLNSSAHVVDVEFWGDYVYAAGSLGRVRIFDISNPSAPVDAGVFGDYFGSSHRVDRVGNVLSVSVENSDEEDFRGVEFYTLTGQAYPVLLKRVMLPDTAFELQLLGSELYVTSEDGVFVLDASTPSLDLIGFVECESPLGIASGGDYLFVADDTPGLITLWPHCNSGTTAPANTPPARRLLASPNPFNPKTRISFELDKPAQVTLDILDIRGRRLCRLLDESMDRGIQSCEWNGRDERGRSLPSGVYLARLSTNGEIRRGKLVLLK